jgi:diguanylate cyclase (GGDEF)-like protein/PAS domain S-box-containing protein
MGLRRKIAIIVVASILLTAIPASMLVYNYTQSKILANELAELIKLSRHESSLISERLFEGKPKLAGLARLLQKELSAPSKPNEIQSFYDEMELNADGVWRNRQLGFDGNIEAGVFLPPNPNDSDQQKIIHMRIKHVMDYFGSAATKRFENVWYLSPDRSEIIFDTTFPNFAFDQQADNDYTSTPWVTYTSPDVNPSRQFIFTPALYDPVPKVWMVSALYPLYLGDKWIGSLGEDMQLSNVLGTILGEQQKYQGAQQFLVDQDGHFILAGDWQSTLETMTDASQFEITDEPELQKILGSTVSDEPTILSDNVVISGKKYVALGMTIAPVGWHYYKLVSVDEILQPTRQLFLGLIALIFLVSVMSGLLISIAVNRNIVQRIMHLADALRLYESGIKSNLAVTLTGNDEIALAAKEFDVMAERIDQNLVEIKTATASLKESEERWKFALEGAGDGVWDWNVKTGEALFSKRWKQMLGYEEDEFPNLASAWEDHLYPEDKATVLSCLEDYFSNSLQSYSVEFRMRCKDGSWKWILARGMIISRDKALAPERMIGTHTDISQQKNIENQLRQNSNQQRFMLENSPTAVSIATENGRKVLFANKAYTDLVNLIPSDVIGADPQSYYVNQNDYRDILASIAQGKSIKNKLVELAISSGEIKWALASYLTIEYENQSAVLGWFYDVTNRLQAEESLRLHASVFDNAWEGIVITDAQNSIISINAAFSHITGYQLDDVVGKNPKVLSSGQQDKQFYQQMWQSIKKIGHWRGEVWNRKQNGELYAEMLAISSVKDEQENITHYVGIFADITDMKNTEKRLQNMAHYDQLTSLPNRVLLADRLSQNLAQAKRSHQLLAVCFLDLDGFKAVNDKNGHDVGDKLLVEVAKRLANEVRTGDTVSRFGGDEFVILLTNVTDMDELESAIARVNGIIAQPINIAEVQFNISTSIGVTVFPSDNSDVDTLLRHADLAMYEAKQAGRNRFKLFDARLNSELHRHHQQVERIRLALTNNEFCLFYQPKVNLRTGKVVGMEALIRWQHPERGLLGPFEFLPMVESNDLIVKIGDWVIKEALAQILSWQHAGKKIPVSVNIAAKQIEDSQFIEKLDYVLGLYPEVGSELLELEILETSALETVQTAHIVMKAGKKLGVSFALDDFGTGYSSLSYLKQLPAKTLKIDQTFIRDMLVDMEDQAIVEGIIKLAKVFKRKVIAEGVETDAHGAKLLELGCEVVQGYGIAKPMPAEAVLDWMNGYK